MVCPAAIPAGNRRDARTAAASLSSIPEYSLAPASSEAVPDRHGSFARSVISFQDRDKIFYGISYLSLKCTNERV